MDRGMVEHGATPDMVVFCFDVLIAALQNKGEPAVPPTIPNDKFPLFVTWKKGHHKHLRGCIGTFSNLKLHDGLREYALTSSLQDTRFNPIHIKEIPDLHCAVSLLVKFEPARDYRDWSVGVHGIRIHYYDGRHQRSAVYLPEVAEEQGWDHIETIDNLIVKGGFGGQIDEHFRLAVNVTRFQSSKVNMSYQEYASMKRQHHK